MSVQAIAWVLKQEVGDATAKHVLMCLANYAGEDGENAFPSVKRLEQDTELSERTIREKLGWLMDRKFIKFGNQAMAEAYAQRKDRITVCYDFVLRGAPNAPRESTGCSSPQNGVQITQPRGAPAAPNPSSEIRQGTKNARARGSEDLAPHREEGMRLLSDALKDRDKPPAGRQPTFEAEFVKRFGVKPP